MRAIHWVALVLFGFALVSEGCSSSRQPEQPVQIDPPSESVTEVALPSPLELQRSGSDVVPGYRWLDARDYDPRPMYSNNLSDNDEAWYFTFFPENQLGQPCWLSGAAYAMYHFQLPDYKDESYIRVAGENYCGSSEETRVWMGIANYESNHWEWYRLVEGEGGYCDVGLVSLDPYFDEAGNLYVAVVDNYATNFALRMYWVRVGSTIPPHIHSGWSVPDSGPAPLEVKFFFVTDHADTDGYISYIEWDFENDGTFDVSGEYCLQTSHIYEQPGEYECFLRVTDNEGATDTKTLVITVMDPVS